MNVNFGIISAQYQWICSMGESEPQHLVITL